MLKTRIIPCILLKNSMVVKSKAFSEWRNIGNCINIARVYNAREVDELVILDITATNEKRPFLTSLVRDVADECFIPLTIGGGVRSVEDIRKMLQVGADKVAINTEAIRRPKFISEGAKIFGNQCMVVSIDAKRNSKGGHSVYSNSGTVEHAELTPVDWAQKAEDLGAGEILLNSIDRDGMMNGFDLELVAEVSDAVNIPVIACGGAGKPQDFVDVVKQGHASAASGASIFLYTQYTPNEVKRQMSKSGIDVRL
ncbi:MAG: glycosyl amidation-associated protein WbuZ [Candidatus Micrarchaeota archaeon]